ncbi:MAG: hypothetical protein HY816_02690 [Candidatus Wallbacteria bacterium]|nr:hypothetical protein [Candidatus Wallbacteria bacterium]
MTQAMDDISSFILENFYKDDRRLVQNRRVSAIVGACYLLNLKKFHPELFGATDSEMLAKLLGELKLEEDKAAELIEEINRGWKDSS